MSLQERRQDASASQTIEGIQYNRFVLRMRDPVAEKRPFCSKKRKNIVSDVRLSSTASISIEKVKRKTREWVNGEWQPSNPNFGYRITKELPGNHAYTLDQLREIHYNLGEFLKNEKV